jgi:RsiW-degrading membrane proteinase PrsW (M82 family)
MISIYKIVARRQNKMDSQTESITTGARSAPRRRLSTRQFVAIAGVGFWLTMMFLSTGSGGLLAFRNTVLTLLIFWVLASATRTIGIGRFLQMFLIGGAMMGIAWIAGKILMASLNDPGQIMTSILVPVEEETLKLAPVLFVLWSWRKARLWSLGATDVLLMGLAVGAGFAMVEDASIFHHLHMSISRSGTVAYPWLPTVVVEGAHTIAGHAIWAGLSAGIVGIVLLRFGRALLWPLAISGWAWSVLDHLTNNLKNHYRGPDIKLLLDVTGDGAASIYLFSIVFAASVVIDLYAIRKITRLPETKVTGEFSTISGLKRTWAFLLERRAMAYLVFRSQYTSGVRRARLLCWAALLDESLQHRHMYGAAMSEVPTPLFPLEHYFISHTH